MPDSFKVSGVFGMFFIIKKDCLTSFLVRQPLFFNREKFILRSQVINSLAVFSYCAFGNFQISACSSAIESIGRR